MRELLDSTTYIKAAIGKASRGANRRLADRMANDMRSNVPVDTGKLQSTIRVVEEEGQLAVRVGDEDTPYLGAVEFGLKTRDYPARPFVRPAAAAAEVKLESEQLAEARKVYRRVTRG